MIPDDRNGIPFVVQTKFNNMVSRRVNERWMIENNEPVVAGNCLVLGVTLNVVSYQPQKFGASQVITARNENLNPLNGRFLASLIDVSTRKFTFKEKPGLNKYKSTIVKLPAHKNEQGELEPDWLYMENYMKNIQQKTDTRLDNLQNKIKTHKTA